MKKLFLFAAILAATMFASCGGANKSDDAQADTLSYMIGMAQGQPDQIYQYLSSMDLDSTYIDDFIRGIEEGMKNSDDKHKLAYMQGLQAGLSVRKMMFANAEHQFFGNDSTRHLNPSQFLQGMRDGIAGKTQMLIGGIKIGPEQALSYIDSVGRILNDQALAREFAKEKRAADDYMAKIAKTAGVKPLADGVYYKVITEGTGARVGERDTVKVTYVGTLIDGTQFDASKNGEAVDLPISGVVPGFKAALLAMPIGSKWEVYIPYSQAYGARPMGDRLPAFSNLIFTIELVGKK